MMYRYALLITLSSIFIYGCGSSNSNSEKSKTLEGKWIKACSLDNKSNVNDSDRYSIITITYSKETTSVYRETKTYQDKSCSAPIPVYNPPNDLDSWENPIATASGQFFIYEDITTTGGLQATQIFTAFSNITGKNIALDDYNIFYINANTLFFSDKTGVSSGVFPNTLDLTREYIKQK